LHNQRFIVIRHFEFLRVRKIFHHTASELQREIERSLNLSDTLIYFTPIYRIVNHVVKSSAGGARHLDVRFASLQAVSVSEFSFLARNFSGESAVCMQEVMHFKLSSAQLPEEIPHCFRAELNSEKER
jgi:hypothetical protein